MKRRLRVPIPGPRWYHILLRIAGVLTLVALALMIWSVFQPTPMPVLLAMSIGQGLGTAAFAIYGLVVFADLRRQWAHRREIEKHGGLPPRMKDDEDADAPGSGSVSGSASGSVTGSGSASGSVSGSVSGSASVSDSSSLSSPPNKDIPS